MATLVVRNDKGEELLHEHVALRQLDDEHTSLHLLERIYGAIAAADREGVV